MTNPTFDYSTVTLAKVEDVDLPRSARGAGRTRDAHPWDELVRTLLRTSQEQRTANGDGTWTGKAKALPVVPQPIAVEAERLVRYHAAGMKLGSTVSYQSQTGQRLSMETVGGTKADGAKRSTGGKVEFHRDGKKYNGSVRVIFAAKSPKKFEPKN